MRVDEGSWALTEKEKQTLRLIVRGHDAKSTARSLGLSVHTINERLRDARRKMAVSSSRQAARLLLEAEGDGSILPNPELFGDTEIGEDEPCLQVQLGTAPISGARREYRRPSIMIGVLLMTVALGLLAMTMFFQAPSSPEAAPMASQTRPNSEPVDSARHWLSVVDEGRWDQSYRAMGTSFRKLNSAQVWAQVSEKVRTPLGAVISRTLVGQENLPAPPYGYEVVKFRTRFTKKAEALETVTLDREDGSWRVVGVTIE